MIAEDVRLGVIRDQEAESDPKVAIANYVTAMGFIDMTGCPDDFQQAYLRHRNAWAHLVPLIAKYEGFFGGAVAFLEGLSGDGHYGEEKYEKIMQEIRDSWTDVELICRRQGVNVYYLL